MFPQLEPVQVPASCPSLHQLCVLTPRPVLAGAGGALRLVRSKLPSLLPIPPVLVALFPFPLSFCTLDHVEATLTAEPGTCSQLLLVSCGHGSIIRPIFTLYHM